eukprot:366453-Chlamydomonas_euryale.AAC.19
MPTAHCPLLTAHRSLPTAHCPLLTAHCPPAGDARYGGRTHVAVGRRGTAVRAPRLRPAPHTPGSASAGVPRQRPGGAVKLLGAVRQDGPALRV